MTTLPTYTYLADFVVVLDRADHLVIEQLDDRKVSVKGIDFGIGPKANTVVGAWLELDTAARDELAPAINAYLHKLFADWQAKGLL
jgi:hypothetical protein